MSAEARKLSNGSEKSMLLSQISFQFPICGPDESCKTLSETKTQFMENELCRCGEGTHCPVAGNHKAKSFDFGLGRITQLYCQ